MTEMTQLNVRIKAELKGALKTEAKEAGVKLEQHIESILESRGAPAPTKGAEKQVAGARAKRVVKAEQESPFTTKKQQREEWDRQHKKLPPEMRDAWAEENPRP